MSLRGQFRIGTARDYEGCGCEGAEGCERPVYGRLCTESDSWGAEWMHLCKIHYLAAQCYERLAPPELNDCDWCHAIDVETIPTRDTDEGSHGPVYDVCKCCRQKQAKRDMEEMEQYSEMEDDSELYENLDDLRAELSEEDEEEDPEVVAINDLWYELSQSTLLTREDIRALLKGAATETIRQIADNCTEGQYSRLFPRVI